MRGPGSASLGSALTALPWCCIAPAALSAAGVLTAGVGSVLADAVPFFLIASLALLARALQLALVRRHGPPWVRAATVAAALVVAGIWTTRLAILPG